jgi:hypothetical protein
VYTVWWWTLRYHWPLGLGVPGTAAGSAGCIPSWTGLPDPGQWPSSVSMVRCVYGREGVREGGSVCTYMHVHAFAFDSECKVEVRREYLERIGGQMVNKSTHKKKGRMVN